MKPRHTVGVMVKTPLHDGEFCHATFFLDKHQRVRCSNKSFLRSIEGSGIETPDGCRLYPKDEMAFLKELRIAITKMYSVERTGNKFCATDVLLCAENVLLQKGISAFIEIFSENIIGGIIAGFMVFLPLFILWPIHVIGFLFGKMDHTWGLPFSWGDKDFLNVAKKSSMERRC